MRNRARACFVALVWALASSIAADAFADLSVSATAMACCAKSHGDCAGLNAPDTCCKRMGHTGGGSIAGTPSDGQAVAPAAIVALTPPVAHASVAHLHGSGFAFKRPHDPPHLHPFSLLI